MNKKIILILSSITLTLFFIRSDLARALSLDDINPVKAKEYRTQLEEKNKEYDELLKLNKKLQELIKDLQDKNAVLARDYEKLKIDQENILIQSRKLLEEKKTFTVSTDAYNKLAEEREALNNKEEAMAQENKTLQQNIDQLKMHFSELTAEAGRLEKLLAEEQSDEGAKVKKIEEGLKIKYSSLGNEVDLLKKENSKLSKELVNARKSTTLLERGKVKLEQEGQVLKNDLGRLEAEHKETEEQNRFYSSEVKEFPSKFTDMARHNQELVRETADMHYNLGVFYVKSKEYRRATREFEKVLELKPEHPYANYNLGYIYAEYLVDRPLAIKYFKNYLNYAPDAKDADWVRRYILTWEAWQGKEMPK